MRPPPASFLNPRYTSADKLPPPFDFDERPESCEQWVLHPSDLAVGLVVHIKKFEDQEWRDHPAIIRGWDDLDHVHIAKGTGCGSRGNIEGRFAHIEKDGQRDYLMRAYVLIEDGYTLPHCDTPVLKLRNGRRMPKTTYVEYHCFETVSIREVMRFTGGGVTEKLFLTKASMKALEWYRRKTWKPIQNQKRENAARAAREAA